MRVSLALVLILSAAACGKSDSGNGVDAPGTQIDAPVTSIDAPPPPAGFVPLIGRSWTLTAGQTDTYKCTRLTIPTDTYIAAYHADAPQGTHHTVLTVSTTTEPDGDYDCSVGALDYQMLFASGVGTDDLAFPDDVGFLIPAGSKLNLNLHLFDATDHGLAGTTTIYVKPLSAAPAQVAEMMFSGDVIKLYSGIPSDGQAHTVTGGCAFTENATVIALWPHMHQTATHQKVIQTHSGTPTAVLDDDYSFAEQKNYPQTPPFLVANGDRIDTTCTYVNNTGHSVMFGESSLDEMCFTGIYRYPAQNKGVLSCVDDGNVPNI